MLDPAESGIGQQVEITNYYAALRVQREDPVERIMQQHPIAVARNLAPEHRQLCDVALAVLSNPMMRQQYDTRLDEFMGAQISVAESVFTAAQPLCLRASQISEAIATSLKNLQSLCSATDFRISALEYRDDYAIASAQEAAGHELATIQEQRVLCEKIIASTDRYCTNLEQSARQIAYFYPDRSRAVRARADELYAEIERIAANAMAQADTVDRYTSLLNDLRTRNASKSTPLIHVLKTIWLILTWPFRVLPQAAQSIKDASEWTSETLTNVANAGCAVVVVIIVIMIVVGILTGYHGGH